MVRVFDFASRRNSDDALGHDDEGCFVRSPLALTTRHRLDSFVRGPDRVGKKRVINERRRIAVAPFGVFWRRRSVLRDGHFEPLLEQCAQVRFDAHIGQHAAENDSADPAFAELEHEVIGLGPKHAVRRDDDGVAVLDVGLKTRQSVSARTFEAIEI
jgi:hypothetical protein